MTRLVVVACVGVVLYIVAVAVGVIFHIVVGAVVIGVVAGVLRDAWDNDDGAIVVVLRVLGFRRALGFLGFLGYLGILGIVGYLGILGEVVVGLVAGGGVLAVGFLLFLLVIGVVEVGGRRAAQVPAHLGAVPALAPKTLRWVRCLLPGDEGTAWLAEVTSCIAETTDKRERRRYVRSYRRGVPRLIWTSWTEHLSTSNSRELS